MGNISNDQYKCMQKIAASDNFLFVQDIDGVCIPLVNNPLNRKIDAEYVIAASKLKDEFSVLTCGEHEGKRGVNRIIEEALNSKSKAKREGFYLPGLAACGVEYQDNFGNINLIGIDTKEIEFLNNVPNLMRILLIKELKNILPKLNHEEIVNQSKLAICDTRFSPAINLNNLFIQTNNDVDLKISLQLMLEKIMKKILETAYSKGLEDSFYLHISPNIGKSNGKELIKLATDNDIGTTDIQLIINGALKEAGLLVLLNKYVECRTGKSPFGKKFNVRNAPKSINELVYLCKQSIAPTDMPLLIGVGDTVTSTQDKVSKKWSRGGSDRGFLTLIQELGKAYSKDNLVIFVDSSHGEVNRPSVKGKILNGISDPDDILKFNLIMDKGDKEYIEWFIDLAIKRSRIKYK